MRWVALLALVATVVTLVVTAPTDAQTSSSCSFRGRVQPGGGPLEWKPTGRRSPLLRGSPVLPHARTGNTLVLNGITGVGGSRRRGLVAFDVRTLRPLPFNPPDLTRQRILAMAASPTTVYAGHQPFSDEEARIEIQAFDLRTGALRPEFDPPDFREGLLGDIEVVGGRVVIGGGPPFGPGIMLGAYDPATGARLWQSPVDWPVRSLATDGSRVFVEVDPEGSEGTPYHVVAAVNPADGQPIPGWGSALRQTRFRTKLNGADGARVYPDFSLGPNLPEAVSTRDGRAVDLRLPSNAGGLQGGPGGVILGQQSIRLSPGVRAAIGAVFGSTGRLIGTVCGRYQPLTMSDPRHIVAVETRAGQGERSRLVELARPR
jgi:hypothetical protein